MSLMKDKNRSEDISQGLFHLRLQSNKNNPEQCWAVLHVGRVELWVVSWRIRLWKLLHISSHLSTSMCMESERLLCKSIWVVVWEVFCWRAFRNPRDMAEIWTKAIFYSDLWWLNASCAWLPCAWHDFHLSLWTNLLFSGIWKNIFSF